jgi:hypothetical protein
MKFIARVGIVIQGLLDGEVLLLLPKVWLDKEELPKVWLDEECNGPVQEKSCYSSCEEIRISIQGHVGWNAMAQSRRSPAIVVALMKRR